MNYYSLVTIPIIAALITQAIKLAADGIKGNFTLSNFGDYGGMPSAHSALVSALCTQMALIYGIDSPLFAISLIFAILILRDAKGLRNYLGMANKEINKLNQDKPLLNERIGHSLPEIIVGCLIGILIALIGIHF